MRECGVLTEQQLDCFNTQGFVMVPEVLSASEVAALRAGLWLDVPILHHDRGFARLAPTIELREAPGSLVLN